MVDEIDKNIVLDAYDDYELVAHTVREISHKQDMDLCTAWADCQARFNRISEMVPISLYKANKQFGEMYPVNLSELCLGDIVSLQGDVVGPPFVYFSKSKLGAEKMFSAFFERYGLPVWLRKD